MNKLNRRSFMQRTGWAGFSLAALGVGERRAVADPDPLPNTAGSGTPPPAPQEPEIYRFQLGGKDAFVIVDGVFTLPGVQPMFAPEAKTAELEGLLKREFLPPDHITLSVNVLGLKLKSGVVLFDAGAGSAYGPVAGWLARGLSRVGVSPSDVKTVFVTHAHPDHIAGLLDTSGQPVFGSARIVAAKTEVDFWTSDKPDLSGMRTPPETTQQAAASIKKMLNGLKPNLDLKEPGKVADEVELIAAPGHTPGHSLFRVTQGSDALLVIGDAVHVYSLQFAHPEWTMAFDAKPALAASTRRKLFKDAAANQTLIAAYHLPFPGIGHVRTASHEYEWVPKPWAV